MYLMGTQTYSLYFSLVRYVPWKHTGGHPVFLYRFNNNSQSPVASVWQASGEVVNGMKVGSSTGVGWSRSGEGDATSRLGDKTSSGKQNSTNSKVITVQICFHLYVSFFCVSCRCCGFQSGDSSSPAFRSKQPSLS